MNNSEETLMEWRVHLASKKPIQASAVLLLTLLVATLGGFWLGHPLAGIVTFVILAGALSDYLFPVDEEVNQLLLGKIFVGHFSHQCSYLSLIGRSYFSLKIRKSFDHFIRSPTFFTV